MEKLRLEDLDLLTEKEFTEMEQTVFRLPAGRYRICGGLWLCTGMTSGSGKKGMNIWR